MHKPRRHRTTIKPNSQTGRTVFVFYCDAHTAASDDDYSKERIGYADRPSAVAAARIHRETWRAKDAQAFEDKLDKENAEEEARDA